MSEQEYKPGQKLTPSQSKELGEARESWCAVELLKEQDWCRATRQHYNENFKSTIFSDRAPDSEPRCTFQVDKPTHRERRHFKSTNVSCLNI